jgi:hypothetical protein
MDLTQVNPARAPRRFLQRRQAMNILRYNALDEVREPEAKQDQKEKQARNMQRGRVI